MIRVRSRPRLALASLVLVSAVAGVAGASNTGLRVIESSVDGGWTAITSSVAARYSSPLSSSSSAFVTDRTGASVPGRSIAHMNVVTFLPDAGFVRTDGPFTATFTARLWWQGSGEAPVVTALPFRIDTSAPARPDVDVDAVSIPDPTDRIPGGRALLRMNMSDPTQRFVVSGRALESGVKNSYDWSGLASIEVRFFDRSGVERTSLRRTSVQPCDPNCSYEATFAFDTSHVPSGAWTVRVNAFDRAGNRSADSEPVTFVKLP